MEQQSTNTFLKSKMNKDLDERLVPNGEYRDAVNIAISKSEGSNVGAAENIQGTDRRLPQMDIAKQLNALVDGDLLIIIGQLVHEASGYIYLFLTNQDRADETVITDPTYFNPNRQHWIVGYNIGSNSIQVHAGGPFLNFSTYFPINNINLLETQLFWTDNFNQPRSLDVTRFVPIGGLPQPLANYELLPYYKEDQISVCTYSPYKPINVYKDSGDGDFVTTLQNATSSNLPSIAQVVIDQNPGSSNQLLIDSPPLPCGVSVFEEWAPYDAITNPAGLTIDGLQCWTSDGQITQEDNAYISGATGAILDISYRDPLLPAPELLYAAPYVVADEAKLYVSFINPNWQEDGGITTYPGDQTFLEDKFTRFSYRFKYRDGTYSTIAPYTQECFIPKQYGYFLDGDEKGTYESTVVSFMENMVNRILLQLVMPEDEAGVIIHVNELLVNLNVSEIDIIYKESNSAALKVVQTLNENLLTNYWLKEQPNTTVVASVTVDILKSTTPGVLKKQRKLLRPGGRIVNETAGYTVTITNVVETPTVFTISFDPSPQDWDDEDILTITQPVLEFDYQNNEPYKTLPADQLTRVYDKVPVKALCQEIISNRITYANYQNKHTPPASIDYQIGVSSKFNPTSGSPGSYAYYSYPNHTVKQNRNYQVGFVLSDRYGRSSSVILSSRPDETITIGFSTYGADTIYHPYKTPNDFLGQVEGFNNVLDWPGDSIKVLVNDIITSIKDTSGVPGLYNGDVSSEDYNPLGWYSYKIVVKQQQQEYYNVYLPYIVNGLAQDFGSIPTPTLPGPPPERPFYANPDIPDDYITSSLNEQASIVLINDNINKVPRDLTEVGPDQEQFRSSIRMWGRVTPQLPLIAPFNPIDWDGNHYLPNDPTTLWVDGFDGIFNEQYYPNIVSDVVSTIATQNELYSGYVYSPSFLPDLVGGSAVYEFKPGSEFPPIYNSATNPLVATITTQKAIGASGETIGHTTTLPILSEGGILEDTWPYTLSVYETEPDESRLDIYWETSTSGLIADLNAEIIENVVGVASAIGGLFPVDFYEDRSLAAGTDPAVVYLGSTETPYFDSFDLNIAGNPSGPIISGDFYFVDDLGSTVPIVEINNDWEVVDGEGNDVRYSAVSGNGLFDILRTPGILSGGVLAPWNFRYDGVTGPVDWDTFVITINKESVFLQQQTIRHFEFTLYVPTQNLAGEWITEQIAFQIDLSNITPGFETLPPLQNFKPNCFTHLSFSGPCLPAPAHAPQIRANNGTAIPLATSDARYNELDYSIFSVIKNSQELVTLNLFGLQNSATPYTMEAYINSNNGTSVTGQYDIIIRVCDCDSQGGLCSYQHQTWIFGETPVNCNFLMETAIPPAQGSQPPLIIPTINPFATALDTEAGQLCCQGNQPCEDYYCNHGIARGSDGAMIIWTSRYDPATKEPLQWDFTNTNVPLNWDADNTIPNTFYPFSPGVPYVWLWDDGNDPDCADIVNPPDPTGPGGCTQGPNVVEGGVDCKTNINSLDMSYGPSWCTNAPSGLTQGTAFITIKYKQLVDNNVIGIGPGEIFPGTDITSDFKVYLQARKDGIFPNPPDPWSDSEAAVNPPPFAPTPVIPRCLDIEGRYINSVPDSASIIIPPPLDWEEGLLNGDWKVGNYPFALNGGILNTDIDIVDPLTPNNPYPIAYWNTGDPQPSNTWTTKCQTREPGQSNPTQYTIEVSRTVAFEGIPALGVGPAYRLLISAIRGTLTRLTANAEGATGCTHQYTNDNNCILTVEYGDFYYPNGTNQVAWRYEVSVDGAANQLEAQNYDTQGGTAVLWAREPFFRYITQFYSDPQLTIPWTGMNDPGANVWHMYKYYEDPSGTGEITPGVNSNPYGNDAASYRAEGTFPGTVLGTGDRRWICRLNGNGLKQGHSYPTSKLPN